ncbi:putative 26s proteasome non-atpase regulatory subunit [Phaeomoniella chlamydospora]|uniref:Probable 26S proteasome regulatory subunit p27 n=1 Tax=Phaeomoniella chlamydospora TaxID=158046 RepID=A0A0G2HHX1_PHACM|nr:putative 26s proteasome non-atpase regulatory subunit [Phaeomoniella chlamydospora]
MGLPMNDLHTPTVPSGPTSALPENGNQLDGLTLTELLARKDNVEAELRALSSVLVSHGVNMNTTLTTFDGYPRDDIDVAQIRSTRARIIRLKNDYKELMKKIETGLHDHHARLQAKAAEDASKSQSSTAQGIQQTTSQIGIIETPFAKVNTVADGSPAQTAGMKQGDGIRSFGEINWMNHENLTKVAEVVQRNEGQPIVVKIHRKEGQSSQELTLQLIPRRGWGGRGLLGCHLLPA